MRSINDYILRRASECWWLVSKARGEVYEPPMVINDTAAEIVKMLQAGIGVDELAGVIAGREGVDPAEVAADVRELLAAIN